MTLSGVDALVKALTTSLPQLADKLRLERVEYSASRQRAVFFLSSDVLVDAALFHDLKRALTQQFPKLRVTLRVASPSLAKDLLENPDKYRELLTGILVKPHPGISAYADKMRLSVKDGSVGLDMPDAFSYQFAQEHSLDKRLSQAIVDIFGIKLPVHLAFSAGDGASMARVQQAREDEKKREEVAEKLRDTAPEKSKTNTPKTISATVKAKARQRAILGRRIADEAVAIHGLGETSGRVTVAGRVVKAERRDIPGKEFVLINLVINDGTDSIPVKFFLRYRSQWGGAEAGSPPSREEVAALEAKAKRLLEVKGLKVRGTCQYDSYDKVLLIMAQDAQEHAVDMRQDTASDKRIEFHAHTKMSNLNAVVSASDLIARAAKWGHKAIAITDHAVVQAFPEAFGAAKKHGIKLIPGMEANMLDQGQVLSAPCDLPLSCSVVVVDFETTGLNPRTDRIIEIGAVRFENGQITDRFSRLIDPGVPLSDDVKRITHIDDSMLLGQPAIAEVMPEFLQFLGDAVLAAHNAPFDSGFFDNELGRLGLQHEAPWVDTLILAQKLYPSLRAFNLKVLCKHLGVTLKNAHRAVHDASATAECLGVMLKEAGERGITIFDGLDQALSGYSRTGEKHVVLLAATQEGMRNLNTLVSLSHLQYFHRSACIPRDEIMRLRAGLVIGSACKDGEIFRAFMNHQPMEAIEKMAAFYDYLEIQPAENNQPLVNRGVLPSLDEVRAINKGIVALGKKLGIPVIATGDVHFMEPEDAIFRAIIQNSPPGRRVSVNDQPPLYFRTTDEMLACFDYFTHEEARQLVIERPAKLLERFEDVGLYPPHPEGKTTFSPVVEDAEATIENMARSKAHAMYGDILPEIVDKRLTKELKAIIGYGYATLYWIANRLVQQSLSDGYLVGSRGSVGSSFVATLCGITEVNPLPAHYHCATCRTIDFDVPAGCSVGIDLPDKVCPGCQQPYKKDGFDIPFEVFLGFKGDKVPDIDLNFSGVYQPRAHQFVEETFGTGHVFRAGTIGTVQPKTAFGYVMKYLEDEGETRSPAEMDRLAAGCVDVKRTTGQHPGGMVVVPKEYDINQFTAVQRPADDQTTEVITTHYDFSSMHDILVKLDILGHDDPTMIHRLEQLTGVSALDIPLDDPKVLSLFKGTEALGIDDSLIVTGTLGVPEFGTGFVRQMLLDTKPTTMEELVRISGLSHGTNVWLGNAKDLIESNVVPLSQCICTRDDIMNALIALGMPAKLSFDIMESVRKGKGLTPAMEMSMREHHVPDWFIDSCIKIKYMFPKAHAAAYVIMALRVAWYKVHHPLAYYAAYFSIRSKGFDALTMIKPPAYIKPLIQDIQAINARELENKVAEQLVALEVVYEMGLRGFHFLPCDLYHSQVNDFVPEGKGLRVPFSAMTGFGEAAAASIVESRGTPYISIEDFKQRTRVNTAGIEMLRSAGALDGLTNTNQVDFFSLMG